MTERDPDLYHDLLAANEELRRLVAELKAEVRRLKAEQDEPVEAENAG